MPSYLVEQARISSYSNDKARAFSYFSRVQCEHDSERHLLGHLVGYCEEVLKRLCNCCDSRYTMWKSHSCLELWLYCVKWSDDGVTKQRSRKKFKGKILGVGYCCLCINAGPFCLCLFLHIPNGIYAFVFTPWIIFLLCLPNISLVFPYSCKSAQVYPDLHCFCQPVNYSTYSRALMSIKIFRFPLSLKWALRPKGLLSGWVLMKIRYLFLKYFSCSIGSPLARCSYWWCLYVTFLHQFTIFSACAA